MAAPSGKDSLQYTLLRPSSLPPNKPSADAAGYDLHADFGDEMTPPGHDLVIPPGERALINTGVAVMLPAGTYGRVAPRSGSPLGIDVLGGVIDPKYRSEVKIFVVNGGDKDFIIRHGDRVAQLIQETILDLNSIRVLSIGGTPRGDRGSGTRGRLYLGF